jgi:fatty acid desaturase
MAPTPEIADQCLTNRKRGSEKPSVAQFSREEVAKHNIETDCWVTIHKKVYDITKWMDKHPGGKEILRLAAGRDISIAFDSYHPFTNKANEVLAKYEIGEITSYEFPPYQRDTGFYKELSEEVNKYFVTNKLDHKDPTGGLVRMFFVMIVALLTNYFAFGPFALDFMPRFALAVVFGICQALPLLHVMHDCSHTSFGHSQAWWMIWGRLFMDFYVGCSMTSWHNQHTMGHHIYSNIFMADPDLPKDDKGDLRRLVDRQTWQPFVKYQYIYMPVLYGLLGISMRVADVFEVFAQLKNGTMRVNPHGMLGQLEHLTSKLFFVWWRIYLPLSMGISLPTFIALFITAELTTGYWLALNFQVSHVSDVADWPMGDKNSSEVGLEWAKAQAVASVDYSHNNWWTTFCCGALNYQIEHHLFPTVSQYHYPAIAPIVMQVCEKHNVRYNLLPDLPSALYHHLAHLYKLGQKGEAVELETRLH